MQIFLLDYCYPIAYSENCQTSKMKLLAKIVNGLQSLASKISNLVVWKRWKYTSVIHMHTTFGRLLETFIGIIFSKIRKASQYLCFPGLNFRVFMELSRVLGMHKCAALAWVLFDKKNSHRIQRDSFPRNIKLYKKPSVYKRLNDRIHVLLAKMGIFFLSNAAWNFSKWYFLLMKKIKDY